MSVISTSREQAVAIIRLNRPEKYNSINREMALQLQAALKDAATDDGIRSVLLCGEGKAFCAGQDLGDAVDTSRESIRTMVREQYNPLITLLRTMEKPIVCAVNGVAAGAGANIALACDVVIAGASASFLQAFSKIGLIPDSGGTFVLPRLIGWQRATALMMTGEKVLAPDAWAMGMVYKVVPDESLVAEGMAMAARLADMPTKGLGLTKRLLNSSADSSLEEQLENEAEVQAEAGQSRDFREGVQAFLEKRKPVFTGQ
jgi:2-(1,2-epoxy-1,2-dihydrophenyl)acetyl-CoA isomerase